MSSNLESYAKEKLMGIVKEHSDVVLETIFEMSSANKDDYYYYWHSILQEVEDKLQFRPFGFNDLHDFFNSPSTDEEEAKDIILKQVFHKEKLTDSECAALNYVIGFNCFWCRKDEKKTFLSGSWRWMAGWIAGLCEEPKSYMDYYCRGIGGVRRGDHWDVTDDEEKIAESIVDRLKELGWIPISLER